MPIHIKKEDVIRDTGIVLRNAAKGFLQVTGVMPAPKKKPEVVWRHSCGNVDFVLYMFRK